MKHFYLFCLFLISLLSSAQIVTIPDANFKSALLSTVCADLDDDGELESDVDTNNDGEIQESEAQAVYVLFYVPPPPLLPGSALAPQSVPENIGDLTGIEAFVNLKKLDISGNLLTTLDVSMLTNLNTLRCGSNDLTSLTLGNNSNLQYLYCEANNLTALDISGTTGLKFLACNINAIETLNVANHPQLEFLSCYSNMLTSLTFGGNTLLNRLYCGNNLFEFLDLTSTGISLLYCNDNPNLEQVFLKNGVLSPFETPQFPFPIATFSFVNTPQLEFICGDDNELNAIVDSLNGQSVNVTSYCSFTPGGSYNTVTGNITLDCAGTPVAAEHIKVGLSDGANDGFTFTGSNGNYTIYASSLATVITLALDYPSYFNITPENYTFPFSSVGNTVTADFCISPNDVHPDLNISLIPLTPARPGFDATYKIHYENKGTETTSGEIAINFNDSKSDFVSANPVTATQATNILTWNFTNLAPFQSGDIIFTLNLNSAMEIPPVNIGELLEFTASVDSGADETPNDNMFIFQQTVVGSLDPNDKAVSRAIIDIGELESYLYYTVRFQNTGTFAAENVVVKDLLSNNLDLSTLEMVSASHPYRSTLTMDNKLEFFFENINLPASADDEPGSHGYVAFKIKPKSNLAINDVIANEAAIYFDFNFPIMTIPVITTVVQVLGTADFSKADIKLYPNPARNNVTMEWNENAVVETISVYNALGQLVKTISSIERNQITIDVSDMTTGTYFIKIVSDNGIITKKLNKL